MSGLFWVDYLVLGIMLAVSTLIGIYFGCFGTKQRTATEYLYGGRQMRAIPVGISIFSSMFSSVMIVGLPVEVYYNKAYYFLAPIPTVTSAIIAYYLVFPIYFSLNIKSPFEYLEIRFDVKTRLICAVTFVFHVFLHNSIVLYTCIITLSRMAEVNFITSTWIVGIVCVGYTVLGGVKAVVWTDTFQATAMVVSSILILVLGIKRVGSISQVMHISEKKLEIFDMNLSPFLENSFWIINVGGGMMSFIHISASATSIQRFLTLSNLKQAKLSIVAYIIILSFMFIFPTFQGLVIYAFYNKCDPISSKRIQYPDQLLPLFVLDLMKHTPGLIGLFLAGILSAGLSTISSDLNTIAGIILHDFLGKLMQKNISETAGAKIMKITVTISGILVVFFSTYVGNFGKVFELAMKVTGISYAVVTGVNLLGMLFYKANPTGAWMGALAGSTVIMWISIGSVLFKAENDIKWTVKNCYEFGNFTIDTTNSTSIFNRKNNEEPFILYKLSSLLYALSGVLTVLIVGVVVSLITKPNKKKLDENLVSPIIYKWLIPNNFKRKHCTYSSVPTNGL